MLIFSSILLFMKNHGRFYVVARVCLKFFNMYLYPNQRKTLRTISRKIIYAGPHFSFRLKVGKHVNHRIDLHSNSIQRHSDILTCACTNSTVNWHLFSQNHLFHFPSNPSIFRLIDTQLNQIVVFCILSLVYSFAAASGDVQTYQIRTAPTSTIAPGVVMASSPALPTQPAEEAARKREVRLMKNRYT